MTLPPSGSGSPPVRSNHHSPRSTIFVQALGAVRQLAFVNEQARVDRAVHHGLLNLVERHDLVLERRIVELQRQERGRQPAGHADLEALERSVARRPRHRLARDENRAVLVAHARAVRQQRVSIDQVRVRVKRDRGDFVAALERGAVQRLDVRQDLIDLDAVRPCTAPLANP